jgi:hypothetical protein
VVRGLGRRLAEWAGDGERAGRLAVVDGEIEVDLDRDCRT